MKIVYQNVVILLLIVVYNYLCLAKDENTNNIITIGGIFQEDNNKNNEQAETILRHVVDKANSEHHSGIHYQLKLSNISTTSANTVCQEDMICKLLDETEDLVSIFGANLPIIQSVCVHLEVPYIRTDFSSRGVYLDDETVVNFYPDADVLAHGIANIVQELHWDSFVILYETEEGLDRLKEVLNNYRFGQHENRRAIILKHLGTDINYNKAILKEIRDSTQNRIILDCHINSIIPILQQAKEDAHTLDFTDFKNTNANITTIRIFDYESEKFQNIVKTWPNFDGNSKFNEITTETVLMSDAANILIETIRKNYNISTSSSKLNCIENGKSDTGFRFISYMKWVRTDNLLTEPIEFDSKGRRINFTISVVEILKNVVLAQWYPPNIFSVYNTKQKYEAEAYSSLENKTLKIISRLGAPYLQRKRRDENDAESGGDEFEGFSVDLITEIAKKCKFNFTFMLAEDGKYGNFVEETQSWNGLIKEILNHNAHLGICDLTITEERREAVDFSVPFLTLGISILYRKPIQGDTNLFAFLDPFSNEVWFYTATLYLVISLILYFVARMAPGDWENPHPCNENPEELENIWNLKNCFWLTMGSVMTQGSDILPKGISSRMVSTLWWFFSLIMTSSYTANLAAFLTKDRIEATIDNAEELSQQTKIKYGVLKDGSTQNFFAKSNYSTYQRMWANIESNKGAVLSSDNADGVKRVLNPKLPYAFLMENTQIEYEMGKNCSLKQIGSLLDNKGYGIAMPMNAPYRHIINIAILNLQRELKINELKQRWWKDRIEQDQSCADALDESPSSELAITQVGGVFIVLGSGIGIGLLLAIVEFLWNVRNVSVEQHISYLAALKLELIFALKIWITKKRITPTTSTQASPSSHSKEDRRSIPSQRQILDKASRDESFHMSSHNSMEKL